MKVLKSPWGIFSAVWLGLGAVFSVMGAIFFALRGNNTEFGIMALVFGSLGVVWLVLGLVFFGMTRSARAKLERLRGEMSYAAEIVRVVSSNNVQAGRAFTVYVECSYTNQEGKSCLVRSGLLMLRDLYRLEGLHATVYVNRSDPGDYAVEVSAGEGDQVEYDYDYRR